MSDYKGIKGFQVTTRTEDPTPYAQALADNPYAGAWASGSALNTGRNNLASVGVNAENLLAVSGEGPPNVANVEQWNGSSWTEIADVNSARRGVRGFGTYTSGIIAGGYPYVAVVESWNGSSWTEVGDLNVAKAGMGSSGSANTAGIVFGGNTPTRVATTESWDGSSWTEVSALSTARYNLGGAGANNLSALAFGGLNASDSVQSVTEEWSFSGLPPSTPAAAYADAITGDFYYNSTTGQFKTVNDGGAPIGTWASSTNLNSARTGLAPAQAGTQTLSLAFGGETPGGNSALTESWDGSSWTEVGDMNQGRQSLSGAGTYTAALVAGGLVSSGTGETEEFNGTSWSEQNDMNTARYGLKGAGTQTAALVFAGTTGGSNRQTTTEKYDGTSWTEVNDLNAGRTDVGSLGPTQSTAMCAGGNTSPGANYTNAVENFDGTSWTEVTETNANKHGAAGSGTTTSGLIFGGNIPSVTAATEFWNGTTWTEVADLGTARASLGGAGTSGVAIGFGGNTPTRTAATEEFTAADFQIKSVTTS